MFLQKIENDLGKRNQTKKDFYFNSIGMIIKKRRIEKNMTQENVAKGICSNTYLSKFENNNASMNYEYLDSIMERIELGYESIMLPEEMIDLFKTGFTYYVNDDIGGYDRLISTMKEIEFAVLVELTRLGHILMKKEGNNAQTTINNLYHYLQSFDDEALAVFIVYQGATHLLNDQYHEAIETFNLFEKMDVVCEDVLGITSYLKMIAYGRLCLFGKSSECAEEAKHFFLNRKNYRRLALIDLYQLEFSYYENGWVAMPANQQFLSVLKAEELNHYHLFMALSGHDSYRHYNQISVDSPLHYVSLFLKGLLIRSSDSNDEYETIKSTLKEMYSQASDQHIPLHFFLSYIQYGDYQELKDLIYQHLLPYAYKHQFVYLMRKIGIELGVYYAKQKRYKDAYAEQLRINEDISRLQYQKKTIEIFSSLSSSD